MPTQEAVVQTSREWAAACEVQQRSMQHGGGAIYTLDYSARCRQLQELGGDFYDFIPLPNNRLALAVGDASGKGLAVALMISNVQSSLRTAGFFTGCDGAATLEAVNCQVYASSPADRYATLFYGVFDGSTRTLRYVNAGLPPPIGVRRDGSIAWLQTGGAPIGMFRDWKYEEATEELDPGDRVFACTDGVIEALGWDGEEWGAEGFQAAALENNAASASEMVDRILKAMDDFSNGSQSDDATVLALRVR